MSVSHRTMVAGVVAFAAVVLSVNLQARTASETASTQVSQSKTVHEPRTSTRRVAPHTDPFELISASSLLRFVDALTAIEAHSGWPRLPARPWRPTRGPREDRGILLIH